MKTFTFLAKQGQHNRIAWILTRSFGKPRLSRYKGHRGEGVMVELDVVNEVSKQAIDRLLFDCKIPGAVKRTNLPVVKGETDWDVIERVLYADNSIGADTPFKLIRGGKFQGTFVVTYKDYGCGPDCCGSYTEVVPY